MQKELQEFNVRIISDDDVEETYHATMSEALETTRFATQGDEFIQVIITYVPGYRP